MVWISHFVNQISFSFNQKIHGEVPYNSTESDF